VEGLRGNVFMGSPEWPDPVPAQRRYQAETNL
jgi:hypothetical protein